MRRDLIVVAGSLAQKPGYGGHTWALLQYVLGFRELVWDVLLLDEIVSSQCVDEDGHPCAVRDSVNIRYLVDVLRGFDLSDRFALIVDGGAEWIGLDSTRCREEVTRSAFLLNIMGCLSNDRLLDAARRRVFFDIDPGFGQMWTALGLCDVFAGHDAHVTIGERIGAADCEVPTCGIDWITTPPPIVLTHWRRAERASRGFSSVARWRGAYGPVEFGGKTYGLRVHEFRKFFDLPRRTGERFEIALDIDPTEIRSVECLTAGGWTLIDPVQAAPDPWRYQEFIQASAAEFSVAKNMYVETRCGWLSDRSLCYLASGRPVLAQDTGWTALYPAGDGLVPFRTMADAEAGVATIMSDYARHQRAARAIAEEYFDSKKVLQRLLSALNVT